LSAGKTRLSSGQRRGRWSSTCCRDDWSSARTYPHSSSHTEPSRHHLYWVGNAIQATAPLSIKQGLYRIRHQNAIAPPTDFLSVFYPKRSILSIGYSAGNPSNRRLGAKPHANVSAHDSTLCVFIIANAPQKRGESKIKVQNPKTGQEVKDKAQSRTTTRSSEYHPSSRRGEDRQNSPACQPTHGTSPPPPAFGKK
jgi:hypothetical protein